jgi:hypothetical protein
LTITQLLQENVQEEHRKYFIFFDRIVQIISRNLGIGPTLLKVSQFRVRWAVEVLTCGYKIRLILTKNEWAPRKLLYFEN